MAGIVPMVRGPRRCPARMAGARKWHGAWEDFAMDGLSLNELALEAETTPERVRRVEPLLLCRWRPLSQRSED